MSLMQFLRMLHARRMIVLAAFLSCLLTAAITAFVLPPRYEARARVMLDVLKPDPITGQVMTNSFMRAYTVTQVEMMKGSGVSGRIGMLECAFSDGCVCVWVTPPDSSGASRN